MTALKDEVTAVFEKYTTTKNNGSNGS